MVEREEGIRQLEENREMYSYQDEQELPWMRIRPV